MSRLGYDPLQSLDEDDLAIDKQLENNDDSLAENIPYQPKTFSVKRIGFDSPGHVAGFEYSEGAMPYGCFRVKTLFSGISAGNEITYFNGTTPYLHARWDNNLHLYVDNDHFEGYPVHAIGSMQVGVVIESSYDFVEEGDVICMSYGHKTGHTVNPMRELYYKLKRDINPILGIYISHIAPACLNAILHADEEVYGSNLQILGASINGKYILVCGTGVIGLLTAMMCKWLGAAEVAIAGRNPWKLDIASRLSIIPIDIQSTDAGRFLKETWHDGNGARGANVAFQCSGSYDLLDCAIKALCDQSPIIDLGGYQSEASTINLAREFHRNGIKLISAQPDRLPRMLQKNWDRRRLSLESLKFVEDQGDNVRTHLITHRFPFEKAQDAFELISKHGKQVVQVVLEF